jgi:hypothetical protein
MIKKLIVASILLATSVMAEENMWLSDVMNLIPHGFELNKTTCKDIKSKFKYFEKQEKYHLFGNSNDMYVWCSRKNKKLKEIRFFNNEYFKKVNLDIKEGKLFEQASRYYDEEDGLYINKYKDGDIYAHEVKYNQNIKISISNNSITISYIKNDN